MAKKVESTSEFKLPNPLEYRLNNPNYTIYHRAALGGLAATVRAWGNEQPEGIKAEVQRGHVSLSWNQNLTDRDVLQRIIDASFMLTTDGMIDLPGQRVEYDDLRLAIHNGLMSTFLDHPSAYEAANGFTTVVLRSVDDEFADSRISYKPLVSYGHKEVTQRTMCFDGKGNLLSKAQLPKWIVPGAFTGAHVLEAATEETFLLTYLIISSAVFLLPPNSARKNYEYCVVIPDVNDLTSFSKAIERVSAVGTDIRQFKTIYLTRVVGGAAEAALRFLIDMQADDVISEHGVDGCLAVTIGKVAWDPKQNTRSVIAKIRGSYEELDVFKAAHQYLSRPRILKNKKGESFIALRSPIPELVAANLGADKHWCSHFSKLVRQREDFTVILRYMRGGLRAMKDAIRDADDQAVIGAFQEAWRRTMGEFKQRSERGEFDFDHKVETEREKMRNAILRTKTADALTNWFLRFCADATKGSSLSSIRKDSERMRKFIFNPRNFERLQNLCLFALVSYSGSEVKSATEGAN
jgi:CRISPR-associated protein Cas8a1/Csx13